LHTVTRTVSASGDLQPVRLQPTIWK